MKNYTYPQLMLVYSKLKENEFEYTELQSRLVWAVANGWKKPNKVTDLNSLKMMGVLEER